MSNKGLWAKLTRVIGGVGSDVTGTAVTGNKHALDVAVKELIGEVTGTFTPGGLQAEGKYTAVDIDDTSWTVIPTVAQTDRNQINIQNFTGFEVKINHTGAGAYVNNGMRIPDQSERFYQITDALVVYARAASGSGTVKLDVEELA